MLPVLLGTTEKHCSQAVQAREAGRQGRASKVELRVLRLLSLLICGCCVSRLCCLDMLVMACMSGKGDKHRHMDLRLLSWQRASSPEVVYVQGLYAQVLQTPCIALQASLGKVLHILRVTYKTSHRAV